MGKVVINPLLTNKVYVFRDRVEAGYVLAEMLRPAYAKSEDTLVLAIPAGGVPVGLVIAKELGLPFDLLIVRKIHFPDNPEAGFGAITSTGEILLNEELVAYAGLTEEDIAAQITKEKRDIQERERIFRKGKPFPEVKGKKVILVDDGLASGYTMMAAIKSVTGKNPAKTVVAVPTASERAVQKVAPLVDELYVANLRSGAFFAVADAYQNWYDLSRDEVINLLASAGYFNGETS
ncbi:phosphoribosyltransferase [Thermodesulfatator atlanticus]|uniref:phosphoribosyltransferase n=1 Tax=Thermodesulfatator atlanticus TaxID=501497 RepID=UPI0003B56E6A|nr:phosphoribosyltransferase family protein [Thermodesulfatator atlanticus]